MTKEHFYQKHLYQKHDISLNYYEIKNGLQPLVLIHAQGVDATSFKNVWKQLSTNYHIYSVDCYGHGESLHDARQYNIEDIGKAIISFIENVVGKQSYILGHSSGGLIAAYIASHTELCSCLILEDPPFFHHREKDGKQRLIILIYQQSAMILSTNRKTGILCCFISVTSMHGICFRKNQGKR